MNKQKVYTILCANAYNKVISKNKAKEVLQKSELGCSLPENLEPLWNEMEQDEMLVHNARFILL